MGAAKKLYTARSMGHMIRKDLLRTFLPTWEEVMGRRRGKDRIEGGVIGTAGLKVLPPPAAEHRDSPPWREPARPRPDAPAVPPPPVPVNYEPTVAPELLPWI